MIVFLAGMQRSGSTFAFNVARDVLSQRGSLHQDSTYDIAAQLAAAGDVDHLLLKAHDMDRLGIAMARTGAIKVICTVRRPEDAVASFIQAFGISEGQSIDLVKAWLAMHAKLRATALTIHYDMIDHHPVRAARMIGRFLYRDVGWRESRAIAQRHAKHRVKDAADRLAKTDTDVNDLGYSYYDTKTLFHRNHVSSLQSQSAEMRLPADQAARIRAAFRS